MLKLITQFACGLTGHEQLTKWEDGRLYLKCLNCGHETPGWDTTKRRRQRKSSRRKAPPKKHLPVLAVPDSCTPGLEPI